MGRGWTWRDEVDISEEEMEMRRPLLDSLARQWSDLHEQEERARFIRQSRWEDGDYDEPDYDFDSEEEAAAERYRVEALTKLRNAQHDAQVQAISDAIHEQGARLMRPYEHWNEDEAYMQYMECDRFGDY